MYKLRVKREKPIMNSRLIYTHANLTLCEIESDDGLVGYGFTDSLIAAEIITSSFKPILIGEDPFFVERLWSMMYRGVRKPVAKGEAIHAISAVDIALWDLIGKELKMPVYKLLGGFTNKVSAYASGGFYEEGKGERELVDEMLSYVEHGFNAVKMKVGRLSLEKDAERVANVRRVLGEEVTIMLDANNAWKSYEAIKFAQLVEKYSPFWIEEPLEPDDIQGLLDIATSTSIPIATGENEYTRYGFRDLIESQSVSIVQPDACLCGGITEIKKISAMASSHHIPVAPHTHPEIHAHLLASIDNGLIAEVFLPKLDPIGERIFASKPKVVRGQIGLTEKPGFGIEIDMRGVKSICFACYK